jgi:hypothetical protein
VWPSSWIRTEVTIVELKALVEAKQRSHASPDVIVLYVSPRQVLLPPPFGPPQPMTPPPERHVDHPQGEVIAER